jgi:hypothetical protein
MAYEDLKLAITSLAEVCDGAHEKDGCGFNGSDSRFGHFLAGQTQWKLQWAVKAHEILRKYSKQLEGFGIHYTDLQKPIFEEIQSPKLTIGDLEALEWSEPKFIAKLNKNVQEAALPNGFWDFWKASKEMIKAAGFSCSQYLGCWQLTRWSTPLITLEATPEPESQPEPISEDYSIIEQSLLYPYQHENAKATVAAIRKYGHFLNTSKVGAGKTFITLVACQQLGLKPFIVCPVPVRPGWIRSLKQLGMDSYGVVNYETLRLGKYYISETNKKGILKEKRVECPYFVVAENEKKGQYEPKKIMTWNLPANAILIFDEAHSCKNRNTQNTQIMTSVPNSVKCIMLSATIAESSLKMVGVGKVLQLYNEPWEFYTFAQKYGARKESVARGTMAWVDHSSPRDMMRLREDLGDKLHGIDTNELRVKGLFPQTKIVADTFDFGEATSVIQAAYESLFEKMGELRNTRTTMKLASIDAHLQVAQKEMQEVELAKIPTIVKMAQDHMDEGFSVAIFVNYTETLKQLCNVLETNCCIYGEISAEEKEANRLSFENNQAHVIICNSAAAGIGIDLHDKYHQRSRISLISPNYSGQVMQQVLGRVDRAGGSATTQYILFAANTIEEEAASASRAKIANMEALNQGIDNFSLF